MLIKGRPVDESDPLGDAEPDEGTYLVRSLYWDAVKSSDTDNDDARDFYDAVYCGELLPPYVAPEEE